MGRANSAASKMRAVFGLGRIRDHVLPILHPIFLRDLGERTPTVRRVSVIAPTVGLRLECFWKYFASTAASARYILIYLRLVACDCWSHVPPGRQFRLINRLRIEIKSGARLGMSMQALNCLNVFARVNQKSRKAVPEVVEAESLTRFKPDANLNRSATTHHSAVQLRTSVHCEFLICNFTLQI